MLIRRLLLLAAILLSAAAMRPNRLAAQSDVIRGRVTNTDSLPMQGVRVTATSVAGNVTRPATTDAKGNYRIVFPGGEGDYIMSFAYIGYAYRQFEIKRLADEEFLVADARLSRVALDTVTTSTVVQQKVDRYSTTPDVSGTDKQINMTNIPPDLQGDLAAMAASLPGVTLIPGVDGAADGFSVLGLGADANTTTLNGQPLGANGLPRDAGISGSLSTSSYDVGKGGFSGANLNVRSSSGSNFTSRGMSLVLNAPQLEWTDQAAQATGSEYSNMSLGGLFSGPLSLNTAFYNVSYQLGRRSSDLQTLLNTDPLGLQTSNVAADSVDRLLQILQQAGIPVTAGRIRTEKFSDQGSLLGSIDYTPLTSLRGSTYNLTANGNWRQNTPVSGAPTELPSHSGDQINWAGGLQGRHSAYFGFLLSETSASVGLTRNYSEPYLQLASGRVRVSSDLDDGVVGIQNLSFGGSPSLSSTSTNTNASASNTLKWYSDDNKHQLKLTTELQYAGTRSDQSNNLLGSFSFNSLQDLEDGRPSSFTRQLVARQRSSGSFLGAISLGDSYRRSADFQLQYGIRLDGSHFTESPNYNADIEHVFGVRNDYVPSKVYISPRIGFSLVLGNADQIASFTGAARVPRSTIRGGIGVFQSNVSSGLLSGALENTGLPSGVQQLNCIGLAAPIPNWAQYASDPSYIPDECADGTSGTVFSNSSPNVALIDKHYKPSTRISSNFSWSGRVLRNHFQATIDGTYSLNLHQSRTIDLNFNPQMRFTLPDEADRPVFVQTSSIVPTTGAIASRDARVSQLFSRVNQTTSDIRSETRQISINLSPVPTGPSLFSWSASYVFQNGREQVSGFSSTVGNPLDVTWAKSAVGAHQIGYNLRYNFWGWVAVNWNGQFRSGSPFTPTIAGNVNGDGSSNDRAFIFDPANTADPALATAMQSLLAHANDATRACLTKQLGQLAARNSCKGPWSSSASLSFTLDPVKFRMPQRARISMSLSNPLSAADLLFNGSGNLKGWGQSPFPDQSLLHVRGFDAATQRYTYEVNQRFGAVRPAFITIRNPVTLTLSLRFDLGATRERQTLEQRLDVGRTVAGAKYPETLMKSLGTSAISNPMTSVLASQDSLHLTEMQADSIASMNRRYTYRVDSLWTPVARYYAALPNEYSDDEAYDRYLFARHATVDLMLTMVSAVKELLSPEQMRKLPASLINYMDPRYLASIRNGTQLYTGGGGLSLAGAPPAGVAFAVTSGGVIVR